MKTDTSLDSNFDEHLKVIELVHETLAHPIKKISQLLAQSLSKERTLFWCGNGGSASDSQHLAAEFVGRFKKNRRALRAIALTTDTSVLTCVANDYSYDDIFSRQVEALGRPGDALIGISTSGNSENVLRAFKVAKEMNRKMRERIILLNSRAINALQNYLEIRKAVSHDDPLFEPSYSSTREEITRQGIWLAVKTEAKKVKIADCTPYRLNVTGKSLRWAA